MKNGSYFLYIMLLNFFVWGFDEDLYRYDLSIEDSAYSQICDNPYISTIRTYFNMYAKEKAFRDSLRNIGKHVARLFENDSIYDHYYSSKFVVLRTTIFPFGGIQAEIVFVKNPTHLFSVWIYRIDLNEYQLRLMESLNIRKNDQKKVSNEYQKAINICTF